jgi:integrase
VFTTDIGTPIDPSNLRRSVDELGVRIGIVGLSPNELRHTAISLLVDAGTHLQEVADFAGHNDVRMLATAYRHKVRPVVDVTASQAQILTA